MPWIARSIVITVFLVVGSFLWSPAPVSAADTVPAADRALKPFLAISEEFNDNIFEVPSDKRTELITRVQPGATFRYQSPFWTWDAAYSFDYRNYARNSKNDEYKHDASLMGNIALVENFLFLDLSDTYHRVTLDVTHNAATESSLFLNQTDQNTAVISPYLLWRMRGDNTLKTGYRYTDIRFWGDGIERREQGAFADLNHEISTKFSLSASYGFTHLESQPTQYNQHDLSGGFRYEYADKSIIFGKVGNSWLHFNSAARASFLFWNAGIIHDMGFAVATVETKVQTAADPLSVSTKETSYSGRIEKTLQRGMAGLSVSYSEFVNTEIDSGKRRSLMFSGTGRYEILQSLTANVTATGERFSRLTATDYPYRFTGVAGLSYALKDDLTLGLTYTHATYLFDLDTTAGSKQINKAVVEMKKAF